MRPFNFKLIIFCCCLFSGLKGRCCINEYRALLDGTTIFTDADNATPGGRFGGTDKGYLERRIQEADSIYRASGKVEDYSDYGALLLYNGQFSEGKKVFQDIERTSPGLYATASNLGTAYELLGQNDRAYFWIKKAININPKSHRGSEWIHLKILEAKIQARNDRTYFETHSVLSLDFGNAETPENKTKLDLELLRDQLYHQLSERMTFVKPKDLIVGQLLFDLGNVNAIARDVKSGLQVYEVAKDYGYKSEILDKRERHFNLLQRKAELRNGTEGWVKKNPMTALVIVGIGFIAALIGLFFIIKRFRERNKLTV